MTVTSAEAGLGLRSIYYHKPLRADGHRFVTLIAYQLLQVIGTRLRNTGEDASLSPIQALLHHRPRSLSAPRPRAGTRISRSLVGAAGRSRSFPPYGPASRSGCRPSDRAFSTALPGAVNGGAKMYCCGGVKMYHWHGSSLSP